MNYQKLLKILVLAGLSLMMTACATDDEAPITTPEAADITDANATSANSTEYQLLLPDFATLAENVSDAVIGINATVEIALGNNAQSQNPFQGDIPQPFRRFFDFPEQQRAPQESIERQQGGSGFIIDGKEGLVITNYHVIKDAVKVEVILHDGRILSAEIIGSDELSDLAVLKIDTQGEELPEVVLGSSDNLRPGEWVMAIGAPFSFDYTVTKGIISAVDRALPTSSYVPFLQTDAAINPGNSGGPLFNLKGEVIGINSQIYSSTGTFNGIAFSIPIDYAKNIINQLLEHGVASRGWLGVQMQVVTGEIAEVYGLDKPTGALVVRVFEDSPAEAAGIEIEDIILSVDGVEIDTSTLPKIIGATAPGTQVKLNVLRNGKEKTIVITIEALETDTIEVSDEAPTENDVQEILPIGLKVRNLTGDEKEVVGRSGVLISEVLSAEARRAGLSRGDVILRLDQQNVENVAQFNEQVAKLPKGKSFPMLVYSGGQTALVIMAVPE